MSIYHQDDLAFDLEIRGNFFVNTQMYPKKKLVIVSFLESLNEAKPSNNSDDPYHHGFLQDYYDHGLNDWDVKSNQSSLTKIEDHIKDVVKPITEHGYTVQFENLATPKGFTNFSKRYGITGNKIMYNQTARKQEMLDYKVVYDTDNDYDPDQTGNGLRIGYNSENYDQTMIAHLIGNLGRLVNTKQLVIDMAKHDTNNQSIDFENLKSELNHDFYHFIVHPELDDKYDELPNGYHGEQVRAITPENLVQFNSKLFNLKYMSQALDAPWGDSAEGSTYNSWKQSNRFLDVSKLNPKSISLKRCAMALGYKIQESDSNRDPVAPMQNFEEIADLIAYNVNDVYVTLKLLESKEYTNRYTQNQQLLKEFPYMVYQQTNAAANGESEKKIEYKIDQDNVRTDRVTVNSTPAKLVENAIAPYANTKIKDNQVLSLNYPDENIAQEWEKEGKLPPLFHGHSRNVLDYIKDLLQADLDEHNVSDKIQEQVWDEYAKVKNLYEPYIGKNFNSEEDLGDELTQLNTTGKKHALIKYINPQGEYFDHNGIGLASYVNLSVGGTHGVEVKQDIYQKDFDAFKTEYINFEKAIDYFNQREDVTETVTIDNLADTIVKYVLPDQPFTHVKKEPLPFNPDKTFGDLLLKSASRKNHKLRTVTPPDLFDDAKVKPQYSYTSSDKANHEDFDSYYPSLISQLAIFKNVDGDDVFTKDLYHPRLKMKHLAKTDPDEQKRGQYALRQLSMKLLINAASGAGDMKYSNRIKCNNKMLAMRIIGQLFCWYIGQSLALHGARIPSTNTDGLYSMNIDQKENDQVVKECAKNLMLKIDPEPLELFVSKDANNRLEKAHGKLAEARGQALTSWQGPSTQNSIDHPAIIDYILAQYLTYKEDAVNQPFDKKFAKKYLDKFIYEPDAKINPTIKDSLRFFQFPFEGNPNSSRYFYESNIDKPTEFKVLNKTNRGFLAKRDASNQTIKMTALQTLKVSTIKKRNPATNSFRDIIINDPIAKQVIRENVSDEFFDNLLNQEYNPKAKTKEEKPRDMVVFKIKYLENDQPVILFNEDLNDVTKEEYENFLTKLDINQYLNIIQSVFNDQWKNEITTV